MVNRVNFTYCVSSLSYFHAKCLCIPASFCSQLSDSFMPSLTKPRRHRIFEVPAACHSLRQEKNSQHRHCHAVFTITLDILFANTGYTTGWKVPCLDSQQHTVRKRRTLQCNFFAVQMSTATAKLSREFPAALQSELSYADWLNCRDKG